MICGEELNRDLLHTTGAIPLLVSLPAWCADDRAYRRGPGERGCSPLGMFQGAAGGPGRGIRAANWGIDGTNCPSSQKRIVFHVEGKESPAYKLGCKLYRRNCLLARRVCRMLMRYNVRRGGGCPSKNSGFFRVSFTVLSGGPSASCRWCFLARTRFPLSGRWLSPPLSGAHPGSSSNGPDKCH